MSDLKEFIDKGTISYPNEKNEYPLAVPQFKKFFSKEAREMWNLLETPNGATIQDLLDKINKLQNSLNCLRHDIEDYELY